MARTVAVGAPATLLPLVLAGAVSLGALGACGTSNVPAAAPAPAPAAPTVDPAVKPYCDAVAQVQAEQASPAAGQGGVAAASATARRQIGAVVAVAPPEIAGDWRVLQGLTDRSLGVLAATGGDPKRIDQRALGAINAQAQPTVAHIKAVTEKRCSIAFSGAGPAPAAAPPAPSSTPTTSSKSSRTRSTPRSTTASPGS